MCELRNRQQGVGFTEKELSEVRMAAEAFLSKEMVKESREEDNKARWARVATQDMTLGNEKQLRVMGLPGFSLFVPQR